MRLLLAGSLVLNLLLGVLIMRESPPLVVAPSPVAAAVEPEPAGYKTNVVVRRQNFSWREIESTNYVEFIENLRSINCPEPTIRDIIVADVNEVFARRRAREVVTPEQEWWKFEPDLDLVESALAKQQQLEAERRELLTALLGPAWDVQARYRTSPGYNTPLTGPVLGELAPETVLAVRQMEARAGKKQSDYLRAQQAAGLQADPLQLTLLERELRTELAAILNPVELEEYLLRYSRTSDRLREELHGLNVTPDEFRSIFRIRDPIDQQIAMFQRDGTATLQNQVAGFETQRDAAIQQTIGPERYQLYKLSQDPGFQSVRNSLEDIGAPPEAVLPIYKMQQALAQEQLRIQTNPELSSEEQAAAWGAAVAAQQTALRELLGEEALQQYQEVIQQNSQ